MLRPIATAFAFGLLPGLAAALEVSREVEVAAPPADVWARIGDFCAIGDWHPAIETCTEEQVDGAVQRRLALVGGGEIVEEKAEGAPEMGYGYSILSGPLPVANYTSTLSVAPSGDGSVVSWMGSFDASGATDAEAEEVIGGIYDAGLQSIADSFAQ